MHGWFNYGHVHRIIGCTPVVRPVTAANSGGSPEPSARGGVRSQRPNLAGAAQPWPRTPRHAGPTPPQPEQQQEPPGHTAEMTPKPDHGEELYKGCGKLEGRAAIITGGDSGIGRAVAIAFAREGADVLISYLPEEEDDARETARWVEQAGRRVVLVPGDISDQQHCKESWSAPSPSSASSTFSSTTPPSSAPTRRSRTSPRRSGTAPFASMSMPCSTCPRPPCRT